MSTPVTELTQALTHLQKTADDLSESTVGLPEANLQVERHIDRVDRMATAARSTVAVAAQVLDTMTLAHRKEIAALDHYYKSHILAVNALQTEFSNQYRQQYLAVQEQVSHAIKLLDELQGSNVPLRYCLYNIHSLLHPLPNA